MSSVVQAPATVARSAGRLWLWLGLAATILGISVFLVRSLVLRQLGSTPWYVPLLGTVGVGLVLLSLSKRRSIPRMLGMLLVVLIASFEWMFLLSFTVLPEYAGPLAGEKVRPFQATLASGEKFTNADLSNGGLTALVFFRGRW